jgi:transposase
MRSGNVSETCRRYGIAPALFYRWKDEAEQGAKAALGGRSPAAAETEKDRRIRQMERTLGRKSLEIEILKNEVDVRRLWDRIPGLSVEVPASGLAGPQTSRIN